MSGFQEQNPSSSITSSPSGADPVDLNDTTLPQAHGASTADEPEAIRDALYRPGSDAVESQQAFQHGDMDLSELEMNCGLGRNLAVGGLLLLGGAAAWEFGIEPAIENHRLQELEEELDALQDTIKDQQGTIADQQETIEEQHQQIDRLKLGLKLIKTDRRIANITVLSQERNEETGELKTTLAFRESDMDGSPIGAPKTIEIEGDKIYIDYLTVQFDDQFVEEGDPLRGKALCLLQNIFSENQSPVDGIQIDTAGTRPSVYGDGHKLNEFQQEIWRDFWDIAHSPERQQVLGIRSQNETAIATRLREGYTYSFTIRADGGYAINPHPTTEADKQRLEADTPAPVEEETQDEE